MKKVYLFLTVTLTFFACNDKAKEANTSEAAPAKVAEVSAAKYTINPTESQIEWKGFKPTGTHNGVIFIKDGTINMDEVNIVGGNVVINMSSLRVLDLEGEGKTKLENHLKGTVEGMEGDFFNVNEYPEATFEITGTTAIENGGFNLSGNLSMKGEKHNITFPVKVSVNGDDLVIKSEAFTIDRTKWGVNYGSKSVFDNLGDSFINDEMELKITVTATKV